MKPEDLKTFQNVRLSPEARRRIARNLDNAPPDSYVEQAQPRPLRMVLMTAAACAVAAVGIGSIWVLQNPPEPVSRPGTETSEEQAVPEPERSLRGSFYLQDSILPEDLFPDEAQQEEIRALLLSETWEEAEPFDLRPATENMPCISLVMNSDDTSEEQTASAVFHFFMDEDLILLETMEEPNERYDNIFRYYRMPEGLAAKLRRLIDGIYESAYPEAELTQQQLYYRCRHNMDYFERLSGTMVSGENTERFAIDVPSVSWSWEQFIPKYDIGNAEQLVHAVSLDGTETCLTLWSVDGTPFSHSLTTMAASPIFREDQTDPASQYRHQTAVCSSSHYYATQFLPDFSMWDITGEELRDSAGEYRKCTAIMGELSWDAYPQGKFFRAAIDCQTGLIWEFTTYDADGNELGVIDFRCTELLFDDDAAPVLPITEEEYAAIGEEPAELPSDEALICLEEPTEPPEILAEVHTWFEEQLNIQQDFFHAYVYTTDMQTTYDFSPEEAAQVREFLLAEDWVPLPEETSFMYGTGPDMITLAYHFYNDEDKEHIIDLDEVFCFDLERKILQVAVSDDAGFHLPEGQAPDHIEPEVRLFRIPPGFSERFRLMIDGMRYHVIYD